MSVHETDESTVYEIDLTLVFDTYFYPYVFEFLMDNFSDEDHTKSSHEPVDSDKEYGIHIPKVDSHSPEQHSADQVKIVPQKKHDKKHGKKHGKKYGIHIPKIAHRLRESFKQGYEMIAF